MVKVTRSYSTKKREAAQGKAADKQAKSDNKAAADQDKKVKSEMAEQAKTDNEAKAQADKETKQYAKDQKQGA